MKRLSLAQSMSFKNFRAKVGIEVGIRVDWEDLSAFSGFKDLHMGWLAGFDDFGMAKLRLELLEGNFLKNAGLYDLLASEK